jgi:hypothetical protein
MTRKPPEDVIDTADKSQPPPVERPTRKVVWSKTGEQSGAYSEHGQHKVGDEVVTMHADHLIAQGWALPPAGGDK